MIDAESRGMQQLLAQSCRQRDYVKVEVFFSRLSLARDIFYDDSISGDQV